MRISDWSSDVCSSDLEVVVHRQVGEAELRQAALAGAEQLAGAAQLQVLLGDAEAVVGLAHDAQARAGGLAERPLPKQPAGGLAAAAADASAALGKPGEADAPGVLDHHERLVGPAPPPPDPPGGQ